jgi:hypothetical protein
MHLADALKLLAAQAPSLTDRKLSPIPTPNLTSGRLPRRRSTARIALIAPHRKELSRRPTKGLRPTKENTMNTDRTSASRQKLLSAKFAAKATIAGLALAASVIAVAPAAQATRPGSPAGTSLDAACYQIGQDYVDGVAAFKAAHAAGDQAAMDAAGNKLRTAEDRWKDICQGVYGSLYTAHAAPVQGGEIGPSAPPKSGTQATLPAGQNAQSSVK